MLTIDREIDKAVYIGHTRVTICEVQNRSVTLLVKDREVNIKHGQSEKIEGIEVYLSRVINPEKVRLGFEGPRNISILRSELYEDENNMKFIDNSTKQFPSGGEF